MSDEHYRCERCGSLDALVLGLERGDFRKLAAAVRGELIADGGAA